MQMEGSAVGEAETVEMMPEREEALAALPAKLTADVHSGDPPINEVHAVEEPPIDEATAVAPSGRLAAHPLEASPASPKPKSALLRMSTADLMAEMSTRKAAFSARKAEEQARQAAGRAAEMQAIKQRMEHAEERRIKREADKEAAQRASRAEEARQINDKVLAFSLASS